MADIVDFPPQHETPSLVGPPLRGNRVVVDGRIIPSLTCHQTTASVEFILDGRFSLEVPNGSDPSASQIAWMLANALAIGAGYPSLGAEAKGGPFARQMWVIDKPD